jgi:DNA-binding PadR family transcriptional regulator
MTLKNIILALLERNKQMRFMDIRDRTLRDQDRTSWGVQVANCLNALRRDGLITRQFVDRESWYALTDIGSSTLLKTRATDEIATSPFWAYDCQIVKSADHRLDASVYWSGQVDPFTRKQISEVITKCPGIKILGHEENEQGKRNEEKKD